MRSGRKLTLQQALRAARETRALEIGRNILGRTPELFRAQFGHRPAVIVADRSTFAVAGKAVATAFQTTGDNCEAPFIFTDSKLHAEHRFVEELTESLKRHDAIPVAVGAGTINDVTKLAAHRAGRPYQCVATAASMDGYTAFGASITFRGSKQTFTCPAPTAVVADIEVIRAAPREMTAAGYADLLAKVTAGADWILADALGVEPIDAQAWNIAQGGLRAALRDPAGARRGEARAVTQLTEGLLLGGFAMQWAKSSRPASGAEHQFSHLWDMEHHTHNGAAPSHGFKVGIATLAVTALYEHLLELPLAKLDVERCCANWPDEKTLKARVRKIFAREDFTSKAVTETMAKYISRSALRTQLKQLRSQWPALRRRLRNQLIPFRELKRRLRAAGAAVEPEQIGISRGRLRESFLRAYYIRRRFTVLDLAARCGFLESSLDALFAAPQRRHQWSAELRFLLSEADQRAGLELRARDKSSGRARILADGSAAGAGWTTKHTPAKHPVDV